MHFMAQGPKLIAQTVKCERGHSQITYVIQGGGSDGYFFYIQCVLVERRSLLFSPADIDSPPHTIYPRPHWVYTLNEKNEYSRRVRVHTSTVKGANSMLKKRLTSEGGVWEEMRTLERHASVLWPKSTTTD